jgi:two-component system sensor histidine kinase MtrB
MKISLRRFVSLVLSLLLICTAFTFVFLWYWSHRSTQVALDLAEDVESVAAAQVIQQNLNIHHRQALLMGVSSQAERHEKIKSASENLRKALSELSKRVSSADEASLADDVQQNILSYLALFDHEREKGIHSTQLYQAVSDDAYKSQEAIHKFINFNLREARNLQNIISSEHHLDYFLVSLLALLLIGIVFVFLWGLGRLVYIPILRLKNNIEGYELGEKFETERVRGAEEIKSIASSFNQLATKLSKQKELQLTFLASIAHDLKNPLSAIKMSTEALEDEENLSDEAREILSITNRQTDHLKRLIEDLLDTTRIESGHLDLRLIPHDIRKILQDSVKLYAGLSAQHRITMELGPSPLNVMCDQHRLTQVLNNLLNNAIKYSPEGGDILVSAQTNGDYAIIRIRDCGVGILPGDIEGIFEPFRRSSTSKMNIPGVGLGLSVSRKIIRSHPGADIEVFSRYGEGSTFVLKLPVLKNVSRSVQVNADPDAHSV